MKLKQLKSNSKVINNILKISDKLLICDRVGEVIKIDNIYNRYSNLLKELSVY